MTALTAIFIAASSTYHIPAGLLESMCWVESKHNVNAIHIDDGKSSSLGECQIKHSTAKWLGFEGSEQDLMNPRTNIYYAAKYLSYQIKRYRHIEKAVISYNQGHAGDLLRTKYSTKVMSRWREYESN